jgi:hypothetical protein
MYWQDLREESETAELSWVYVEMHIKQIKDKKEMKGNDQGMVS